ncbi:MAG: ATP-binding protein [Nitrospirae bacterium YQR-1]
MRISTKILLSLAGLSLLSLLLFSYIILHGMVELSNFTKAVNAGLGQQAVQDSIDNLRSEAEKHLLQTARYRALIIDMFLQKVEDGVNVMSGYATDLYSLKSPKGWNISYSQFEKPVDIYSASSYALSPGVKPEDVNSELKLTSHLDDIFKSVFPTNRHLFYIYIGTKSGIIRTYPWGDGLQPAYDHRARSWYLSAAEKKTITWTLPYLDAGTNELIITCAKAFFYPDGTLAGVTGADVTIHALNDDIINTRVGDEGYSFLIDGKDKLVSWPGMTVTNKKWNDVLINEDFTKNGDEIIKTIMKEIKTEGSGIITAIIDSEEKYIAYSTLKTTGWILCVVMPVDEITSVASKTRVKLSTGIEKAATEVNIQMKHLQRMIAAAIPLILLIVTLAALIISRRTTKPIKSLIEGIKSVAAGNLDYRMNIATGDEIEDLAVAYNKMAEELRKYDSKLKEQTQQLTNTNEDLVKEIWIRMEKEDIALKRNTEQLHYRDALLYLSRKDLSDSDSAFKTITRLVSETIGVARVSIWLFDKDKTAIHCHCLYKADEEAYESDFILKSVDYPIYFNALKNNRIINASYALTDPRTAEFTESYLKPLNIVSMMDAGINHKGDIAGVICCEQTETPLVWSMEAQEFVSSVSDMISFVLESAQRTQTERMLIQQSKLAAMGEMLSMIAHQWRQPLSSISTIVADMQVACAIGRPDINEFNESLDRVNEQAQYLSSTINDFKNFFSPTKKMETVMPDYIIEQALKIIGKSIEYKTIEVRREYSYKTAILTYPNELIQVILNILKNAQDILMEKEIPTPTIVIGGYEDNGNIFIELSNNAGGIPEDLTDKIFEPYFTTKEDSGGTGLGLYMSKTIIEKHCRGTLTVKNIRDGACFTIKLPLEREETDDI